MRIECSRSHVIYEETNYKKMFFLEEDSKDGLFIVRAVALLIFVYLVLSIGVSINKQLGFDTLYCVLLGLVVVSAICYSTFNILIYIKFVAYQIKNQKYINKKSKQLLKQIWSFIIKLEQQALYDVLINSGCPDREKYLKIRGEIRTCHFQLQKR